jgi:hypothetical protein
MGALKTRLGSYQTLHTIADINTPDTDLAAASGFAIGVPTSAVDLHDTDSEGKDIYINNISIIVHATDAADGDTVTQKIYGVATNGPPQLIASIVWTIGTARADGTTATYLWADTATVTSSHMKSVTVADGAGSNRVCSVTLDLTGYRYVLGLWTDDTGNPTIVTALYRYF